MTIEIIKLYVSCISQFFTLSDVAIASSPNNPSTSEIPDFLPTASNSITTCHFVSRILTEIVETSGELEGMGGHVEGEKISSQVEVKNVLKGLAESCRWRFEEAICFAWSKGTYDCLLCGLRRQVFDCSHLPVPDAKLFFHLEGWKSSEEDPSTTTYLEFITALQRHNAMVAWQVAGGSSEPGSSKVESLRSEPRPSQHVPDEGPHFP
jgi:exocyst complex component 2